MINLKKWFGENEDVRHGIEFVFVIDDRLPRVVLSLDDDGNGFYWNSLRLEHVLRNVEEWNRLGAAIGGMTLLRTLNLRGIIYSHNNRNNQSDQCMEAIYRRIETNSSIEQLKIDMNLFPDDDDDDGTVPTLNLHDAQFKTSLKQLNFDRKSGRISENQSFMISSFLENVSLECFDMVHVDVDGTSESAFRRVVLACTNVKKLHVYCESASHYAAVASLIGNPRSILSEIVLLEHVDEEGLSTIATGLVNNTTLKTLHIEDYNWYSFENLNPMAKALCDASSIEGIHRSNHTLQQIFLPELEEVITMQNTFDYGIRRSGEKQKC